MGSVSETDLDSGSSMTPPGSDPFAPSVHMIGYHKTPENCCYLKNSALKPPKHSSSGPNFPLVCLVT